MIQKKKKRTMGFKVEEKFRIILVMQEVNLTNGLGLCEGRAFIN